MKENRVRTKLKRGEQVFGVLTPIFDPQVVEVIAHLGFECYMLDCEHGQAAQGMLRHLFGPARLWGLRRWRGCEALIQS